MVEKVHYPYFYGRELTPEMARRERRNAAYSSVMIFSIWASILEAPYTMSGKN